MKNILLAFFFGVGITFFGTKFLLQSKASSVKIDQANVEEIQTKLKSISENEYQDYLKLKDSAEKYKKADELLGKVMVLFLADLSINLKSSTTSVAAVVKPEVVPVENKVEASVQIEKNQPAENKPNTQSIAAAENKLIAAQTENEALKLLKSVEISDIGKDLHNTKPLSEKQLNLVNGKFIGVVTFDDKNKEPWRIEWELHAELVNGKVTGTQLITLSDSKKVFSRSRSNNLIQDFSAFAGDSSAILINSYGDDGYIQLYPFANTGKIFGNYYLKSKDNSFKKIGIVFLDKIN